MRRTASAAAGLLLGVLALPLASTPAAATSCVAVDATAPELLRGAPLYREDRLFDTFDYALAGTVLAVRPAPAPGQGQAHGVDVDVDVLAAFNRTSTSRRVKLHMLDRGEMLGYPFDVGQRYFIVVEDDQVGLCSPTSPLADVDTDAGRAVSTLTAAALAGGVAVASPSGTTTIPARPATPSARTEDAPSPALVAGGTGVGVAGLAAGLAGVRSRRRGRAGRAGSTGT